MIWTTAKSTEVRRRHSPHPRRATGLVGVDRVEAADSAAGVAMSSS